MSAVAEQKKLIKGGAFLIEERSPEEIFTPEDFTEEHRMIADTTRQFIDNEVVTRIDELEKHDWKLSRELVGKAADLGLIGANIPEWWAGSRSDEWCTHRREHRTLGFVRDDAWRRERYRVAADCLLRH